MDRDKKKRQRQHAELLQCFNVVLILLLSFLSTLVVPRPHGPRRLVAAADPHQMPQPSGSPDVPSPSHSRDQHAAEHACAQLPARRWVRFTLFYIFEFNDMYLCVYCAISFLTFVFN